MAMVVAKMSGHLQTQLTRSLERLLEEAYLSGELKLTGRKLKDFPSVGEKYNLSDTVFAGAYTVLSKRKACRTALLVGRAGPVGRDVKSLIDWINIRYNTVLRRPVCFFGTCCNLNNSFFISS